MTRLLFRMLFAVLFLMGSTITAGERPNFDGSYTMTGRKGEAKSAKYDHWTMSVAQTEVAIKVTRMMESGTSVNNFPLDGTEGSYTSPKGVVGKCKGQFKGKDLILESIVTSKPAPNGPAVEVRTRERWELSSDSRTLTIRSDVDFPLSPINGFQVIEPWTDIYSRN
jgi:hypothetical protein